ncbi:MAG: disulfide bond formation protein B [Candidatus Magasanikbacteria bacterium]
MSVEIVNLIISYLTVALDVALLLLLVIFVGSRISSKIKKTYDVLLRKVKPKVLLLTFLLLFGAVSSSLFYSEIVGYTPCKLCWYQRIFIFSLMVIFGFAVWKRDYNISGFASALALPGSSIAGYHIYLQFFKNDLTACSAGSLAVSCGERYIESISFISIPVMSMSIFLAVILSSIILLDYRENQNISV